MEFATTENHKREISVAVDLRKEGEGVNAVKNSGYFPACSAVVMLKIERLNETLPLSRSLIGILSSHKTAPRNHKCDPLVQFDDQGCH